MPQLDRSRFYAPYEQETRGAPPFEPALMVGLLLYAYCVGVYSSRKLATACERNLAFLALVGDDRPDCRTLSDFRTRHREAFAATFTQVRRLAKEAGLVQLGVLTTDGTKLAGNASRHKAMSYGSMTKAVERLRAEIDALLQQAQQQDAAADAVLGSRRGDELAAERQRREDRLATILAAKQRRAEQARAEAEAERQKRQEAEAERQRTGQKRRGREPAPVAATPDAKAQTNCTDPALKIMQTATKGWDYGGNAQVVVDEACQLILACDVSAASNDKEQAVAMAQAALAALAQAGMARPPDAAGQAVAIPNLTDSGYSSEKAAGELAALGLDPYLATERQRHHGSSGAGAGAVPLPTAKAAMAAKLRTAVGRAL